MSLPSTPPPETHDSHSEITAFPFAPKSAPPPKPVENPIDLSKRDSEISIRRGRISSAVIPPWEAEMKKPAPKVKTPAESSPTVHPSDRGMAQSREAPDLEQRMREISEKSHQRKWDNFFLVTVPLVVGFLILRAVLPFVVTRLAESHNSAASNRRIYQSNVPMDATMDRTRQLIQDQRSQQMILNYQIQQQQQIQYQNQQIIMQNQP